jgi:CheY-like chemotaxis protein
MQSARPGWLPDVRPLAFLAEDEPELRTVMAQFLDASGYDVLACKDGCELLDAIANASRDGAREPDALIIDVRMPGLNGLSVAEELRADGWQQPIIFVSCYAYDELLLSRVRCLARAAFFAKPFSPTELVRVIGELRLARRHTPAAFFLK